MLERLIKNDSIADIIFSYSNEGMIISDGFGKIQYANPKALENVLNMNMMNFLVRPLKF